MPWWLSGPANAAGHVTPWIALGSRPTPPIARCSRGSRTALAAALLLLLLAEGLLVQR